MIYLTIHEAVLYFFLYSFLGWIYESILVSVREKTWSNRGFLIGPICPIYGVGAVVAVLICSNMTIPLTFVLCMLGSAVLEYTTAYALEKSFHASWWDYSNMPFNINGYICLPASLGFGAAGVLIVHVMHPILSVPVKIIPDILQQILALILVAVCSSDLTLTVSSLSDFAMKIKNFETRVNQAISDKYDELENTVSDRLATVGRRTLLTDAARNSIIEREIKKADMKLNSIQRRAVQGIKKFKDSEVESRIHSMLLRLSAKARKSDERNNDD